MAKYSIDVDDVLADYLPARSQVARDLGLPPLSFPLDIAHDAVDALVQERQAANHVAIRDWITDHLEEFFSGLKCLLGEDDRASIYRAAAQGHELFFVSSRSYSGAERISMVGSEVLREITTEWLLSEGLPADNHVILTSDKANVMIERGIAYHLDDQVAHVTNVSLRSKADVYLLKRPYNQHIVIQNPDQPDDHHTTAGAFGVNEVESVAEYISLTVGRPS